MSEFKGFTEAAKLYAENAAVVEAMQKAMQDSVREFLDCLFEEVQRQVEPRGVAEWVEYKIYRCWYLKSLKGPAAPNTYVWFDQSLSRIVIPGEFHLYVAGNKYCTEEINQRVLALVEDPELRQHGVERKVDRWSLLTAKVSYHSRDPVELTAPVISALLLTTTAVCENEKRGRE